MAELNLFRHILRLLSVEEVEELTTVTEIEDMSSLTDLMKDYLCSYYVDPVVARVAVETATAEPAAAEAGPAASATPKSVAEFIFQEKEKFKKFNQQSKKQESMEIYRHTLQHGIVPKSTRAEQKGQGTGKGTLVNRKVG